MLQFHKAPICKTCHSPMTCDCDWSLHGPSKSRLQVWQQWFMTCIYSPYQCSDLREFTGLVVGETLYAAVVTPGWGHPPSMYKLLSVWWETDMWSICTGGMSPNHCNTVSPVLFNGHLSLLISLFP